jgi:hypothetical protein
VLHLYFVLRGLIVSGLKRLGSWFLGYAPGVLVCVRSGATAEKGCQEQKGEHCFHSSSSLWDKSQRAALKRQVTLAGNDTRLSPACKNFLFFLQDLSDLGGKLPHGEWSLEEATAALREKIACPAFDAAPAGKEHLDLGMHAPERPERLLSSHIWHDHIEDHQVDPVEMTSIRRNRLLAALPPGFTRSSGASSPVPCSDAQKVTILVKSRALVKAIIARWGLLHGSQRELLTFLSPCLLMTQAPWLTNHA